MYSGYILYTLFPWCVENTYAIILNLYFEVSEYVSKSQKWADHTDVQCQNGQTAMR